MSNETSPAILTATDLEVRYNEQVVLARASLTIGARARIGLVGRNGSGKSTFLKILAGVQKPDAGSVTGKRDLVVGYLPQDSSLDPERTVQENVRAGAQHVLDLIQQFESLPATSKNHSALEERITALDGWGLEHRLHIALARLNAPDGDRRIDSLSGGEKRRVALCRAIVARPDLLILDEPTNHLDAESIEWVGEFLQNYPGAFLMVTHDRWFLDSITNTIVELANGIFYSYTGNYTDYLAARAERQAVDETVEHKRQMFLRRELDWVRRGPPARTTKSKSRLDHYHEVAAQSGPPLEAEMELVIPPPPQLGNRVVELENVAAVLGGQRLFGGFSFTFENGMRIGVVGRNGAGKTTLLKIIQGELVPAEGTVKTGQLTRFNYIDQGRVQLNEERTVFEEMGDGTEFVIFGEGKISLRAYLKRFLFTDDRISTQVKYLSGGERSRLLLARILKNGGNFLILDEPTNDLDLPTLRILEEALLTFAGVVLVVSHDRYFLNRVCTGILAFEGDGRISHSVGDYDYYLEKRTRIQAPDESAAAAKPLPPPGSARVPSLSRPRKLNWKESRELAGMEAQILAVETGIARIESLFATPDFHRIHGSQTNQLVAELAAAKQELIDLYARWEELEKMKTASDSVPSQ